MLAAATESESASAKGKLRWGNDTSGAGVLTGSGTRVTLDNVRVVDNHATYGGGVYVSSGSVVTLTGGTTLQGNTAKTSGGGARTWGRLFSNAMS